VVSDGTTYYVDGVRRLIGFVDGLKEGAAVKLEGTVKTFHRDSDAQFLQTSKLTFNGKDYDFSTTAKK
jgi:hypothetical protein